MGFYLDVCIHSRFNCTISNNKVTFIFGITTEKVKHAENTVKHNSVHHFIRMKHFFITFYEGLHSQYKAKTQTKPKKTNKKTPRNKRPQNRHLASVSFTCFSISSPKSLDSKIYSCEHMLNCSMFNSLQSAARQNIAVFTVLFPDYPFLNQVV